MELDKSYPRLFNPRRPTCALDNRLVEDQPINHLAVLDGTPNFLNDSDVPKIDVLGGLGVNDLENGVDSHRSEEIRVLRDDLGRQRRRRGLDEGRPVCEVDGDGHVMKDFHGSGRGPLEGF